MRNLNFYKWSIAMIMLVAGTSASAQLFPGTQRDTRTTGIFGNRNDRPVIRQDGSKQWPDGTIQYPDGTTRYPDGAIRYPDGTMSYPNNQRTQQSGNYDHNHDACNMPPGQAKKKYGGHDASGYAKGKNKCKGKNYGNSNRDRDYDDDRNVSRYPQYPQTYPQYPNNQQYPQYPQQNPNTRNKKGSKSSNPVL